MAELPTFLIDGQDVPMPALRAYLTRLSTTASSALLSSIDGAVPYATLALAQAAPATSPGRQARVYADPTAAKNGVYVNVSGAVGGYAVDTAFYNQLSAVVQPLVDQAVAARDAAQATAAAVAAIAAPLALTGSAFHGPQNGRAASIDDGDGRAMLAFGGDGLPHRSSAFMSSVIDQAGVDSTAVAVARLPRMPRMTTSTSIWGLVGFGQSNMAGNGGAALTTTQSFGNLRVVSNSFVPCVETGQESCITAALNGVSARLRDKVAPWHPLPFVLAGNNMGLGGAPYSALKKGTAPWTAGLQRYNQAKALAASSGRTYQDAAMVFIHGEQDALNGVSRSTYAGYVIEAKNDWNTDTAQADRVPCFVVQKGVWEATGNGTSSTTLGQLDAAETDSEVFVIAPSYICDSLDGLHITNYSQDLIGEYLAKAAWRYWVEGRSPSTVRPIKYERIDARTIRATFFVPVPPLVWDTERVWPIDAGLGFAVRNASTGAVLALAHTADGKTRSPVIVSPTEVEIVLAADMPASVIVAYATTPGVAGITGGAGLGRTRGARGNLRDSDHSVGIGRDVNGDLYPLHNWCAIHEKVI